MNNVEIYNLKENDNAIDKLSEMTYKFFEKFKGKSLLVANRYVNLNFIDVFGDSLYNYERGIILLERFFKKDKCKQKGQKYKTITEDEKKLIDEFANFSINIPKVEVLSEEEKEKYTKKIKEYDENIQKIQPKMQVLDVYKYGDLVLAEIDLMTEENLKTLCDMYALFGINTLLVLTWSNTQNTTLCLKTIEYADYVDLILIPLKADS